MRVDFLRRQRTPSLTTTHVATTSMRHDERNTRRNRRNSTRQSQRRRPRPQRPLGNGSRLSDVVRMARNAWQTMAPGNRVITIVTLLAGLSVATAIASIIVQIVIALMFGLVPLVIAPVLLAIAATTGFVFVGSPLFFLAVVAKAVFPIFAVVAASGALFSVVRHVSMGAARIAHKVRDETISAAAVRDGQGKGNLDDGDDDRDDEMERSSSRIRDQLDEFDRMLRRRTSTSKSVDVENWSLNEVLDELDACDLGHYRQLFTDERIDGHTLLTLTDADIRAEFADTMPLGDRRRLSRLISSLQNRRVRPH